MTVVLPLLSGLLFGGCGKKGEEGGGGGGAESAHPGEPEPAAGTDPTEEPGGTAEAPEGTAATTEGTAATTEVAAGTESQPARIAFTQGKVTSVDAEGVHDAAEGALVLPGTVVVVDPDALAEIDLPDGSVLDLEEMTELLLVEASVEGPRRRIDLTLLAGSARVHAAPNADPESYFRLATPAGVTEVKGTEYAVEVLPEGGTAEVVVVEGQVQVGTGDTIRLVTPLTPAPVAVRIVPGVAVEDIEPRPVVVERWDDWRDRQADALIAKYEIDIQAPEQVAAVELQADANPYWRPQIELRRARIRSRALVLVTAVGPDVLTPLPTPRERFERARAEWVTTVYAPRRARIVAVRRPRLAVWTGSAEARVAVRAELAPVMVELRQEWRQHPGRGHGHAHGRRAAVGVSGVAVIATPGVVVAAPGVVVAAPGAVVEGKPGEVHGGAAVRVDGPAVRITGPAVQVQLPGISIGGGVRVGTPPPRPAPPPTVVAPPPTVVVPDRGHPGRGHAHGHDNRGPSKVR
jgi:hypothetical protein